MKKLVLCCLASFLLLFQGCGSFVEPLLKGEPVPEEKVLMIGKVIVSPHFGGKVSEEDRDSIMMSMNDDLNRSINSIDDIIDPEYGVVYFYPVSPGTKFFRVGQVMVPNGSRIGVGGSRTTYAVLRMPRNIKVTIPSKARAVYIGTITYKHNGEKATDVTVRDEQEEAMQALAKMHFRGLGPKDVVKKLAVVLKESKD